MKTFYLLLVACFLAITAKAQTRPNRWTTNTDANAVAATIALAGSNTNLTTTPTRVFFLGDSKTVVNPSAGISNQWPRYFTNLPAWQNAIVFSTNFAVSGYTFTDISNTYTSVIPLLAPPGTGTNNLIFIRDGANDFPTNPLISSWINNYSNLLNDIHGRTNCFSCIWDIQPRTDWPDTKVFERDPMNQALRQLTNWDYMVKAEKLVPDATLTTLFVDGIHANTNGAVAEASIADYAIRFGPNHYYDEAKSQYERSAWSGQSHSIIPVSAWAFNTTYQNTNGYPIEVRVNYQFSAAAVNGNVGFNGYVSGVASATRGLNTATTIPANNGIFNDMEMFVGPFQFYAFTNQSSGANNTITLFGGQIKF